MLVKLASVAPHDNQCCNVAGQCLSVDAMKEIVSFCAREGLVLLADEVYQENVYTQARGFVSFRKVRPSIQALSVTVLWLANKCMAQVAHTMATSGDIKEEEAARTVEMISFHSTSKGFIGECGIRGGYFELYNIAPVVKANLYKLASLTLCSNTHGQLSVGLMVQPPKAGSPSFEKYDTEKNAILDSLKRRAALVEK